MSPSDPDGFVMPDLPTLYHQIDTGAEVDPRKRMEAKAKIQAEFEERASTIHAISQLLRAYCLYQKDVQYVVQDNKVIIVDEHTGRPMAGRRWSDGLHQAVEAKEEVEIERETSTWRPSRSRITSASTLKLAGMTGTAETEAQEFFDIYKLGVLDDPLEPPVYPQGLPRHRLQDAAREVPGRHQRDQEAPRRGPPGPRGNDLG